MNQEVAVIDVIERILSTMLENEWSRARVVAYFSDKYPGVEAPEWEGESGGTPAVSTTRSDPVNPWGWASGGGWQGGGVM